MKIGVANTLSDYQVLLPLEIIATIIYFVQVREKTRTRTLWACCLLSKDWYKVAIGPLYEKPILTNKNFDKFTRTICPPVNAHIRRVGLEGLVHSLDMGMLAYESTKSLTARLIRRTRSSLEFFVAPATTFSVSSLAPLSKCTKLRVLDLSRDFSNTPFGQLLRSIYQLPIQRLSLPRSAMQKPHQLLPRAHDGAAWPATLESLEINDWLPMDSEHWAELIDSLPANLTSLTFNECYDWQSFWIFSQLTTFARSVRTIRVNLRREDGGFPIDLLQKVFPSATTMILPAPLAESVETDTTWSRQDQELQYLCFTMPPTAIRILPKITCHFLAGLVNSFPALRRIDVPEACFELDEDEIEKLEEIEKRMELRAIDGKSSGVFEV